MVKLSSETDWVCDDIPVKPLRVIVDPSEDCRLMLEMSDTVTLLEGSPEDDELDERGPRSVAFWASPWPPDDPATCWSIATFRRPCCDDSAAAAAAVGAAVVIETVRVVNSGPMQNSGSEAPETPHTARPDLFMAFVGNSES